MIRNQWLGIGLATFLALQPGIGFLCQLDCHPVEHAAPAAPSNGCHEQAVGASTAGAPSIGVAAHPCDHLLAPATAPVVGKVLRSGAVIGAQVAFIRLLREAEHSFIHAHDTHAPPGLSVRATDVLRV